MPYKDNKHQTFMKTRTAAAIAQMTAHPYPATCNYADVGRVYQRLRLSSTDAPTTVNNAISTCNTSCHPLRDHRCFIHPLTFAAYTVLLGLSHVFPRTSQNLNAKTFRPWCRYPNIHVLLAPTQHV